MLQWNSILVRGGHTLACSEILGLFAGLFTTFALVPQIMRVFKMKSAREISVIYNTTMLFGIILWLVYGIILGLVPIIIWNIIGALLNILLLLAKFKYGR